MTTKPSEVGIHRFKDITVKDVVELEHALDRCLQQDKDIPRLFSRDDAIRNEAMEQLKAKGPGDEWRLVLIVDLKDRCYDVPQTDLDHIKSIYLAAGWDSVQSSLVEATGFYQFVFRFDYKNLLAEQGETNAGTES